MENEIQLMKVLLASTFNFYLKIHNFHWNVEGPNFHEYHNFFGVLYNEIWASIDLIAEQIRAMNAYCPGSLIRFKELSKIEDQVNIPNTNFMIRELLIDNEKILAILNEIDSSTKNKGLSNFIQGRIDVHSKHGWMLRSMSKNNV